MDRSLDEFVGGSEDDADENDADEEDDESVETAAAAATEGARAEADSADEATSEGDGSAAPSGDPTDATEGPSLAVRPAASTMDWTPGGAACEACGASVERRWRDGDRLVCSGCKSW